MRFKAGVNRNGVHLLAGIAQSIEKVCQEFAVFLSEESFEFRIKPEVDSEVQVFAKLYVDSVFTEYRIESKAKNKISLVLSAKNLISALKSADQADEATFKLTKSGGVPCFSISAIAVSGFEIKQDVPIIRILSENGMKEYREPHLPQPEVKLEFPDPRNVRAVLERMKTLDKFVQLEATSRGALIFKVQTEVVSMRTFYQGLDIKMTKLGDNSDSDDAISVVSARSGKQIRKLRVRLNIKELLNVLQFGSHGEFESVLGCIVRDQALVLFAELEGGVGSITYYVPLVTSD